MFVVLSSFFTYIPKVSYAEVFYYAKITQDDVCFYSSPTKNNLSSLFYLPKSYFVKLLDDENDDFYYAKYKDIYGYVLKNEVTVMNGTPASPFADATFRIFSTDGLGLYKSPYLNENNKITQIPYLTQDITYYGTISGEQVIPEKSEQWYYCNYISDDNYFGFVYSVFCDKLSSIPFNDENFDIVTNPSFTQTLPSEELSATSMTFIIIGVSIPCLIVVYLLLKPTLLKEKSLNQVKAKRKRHGDYYEFDEGDLN